MCYANLLDMSTSTLWRPAVMGGVELLSCLQLFQAQNLSLRLLAMLSGASCWQWQNM